jgi:hypothetical protein
MNTQLIITHPGSAHFDEVTAVSLVLASFPDIDFKIERREPTLAELENPDIWVIDTGNRHEPEKRDFDHHQSLDCPAGFVLIAQYLNLLDALSTLPWWHFKDRVDRVGPVNASKEFNAGDDRVNLSPVESWFTDRFAAGPQVMVPQLKSFGTSIIENARALKRQIDFWKAGRRFTISGVPALIAENRESYGLEEFRRLDPNPPDIVISLDRRSEGWRLYRYDGTPVDFTRVADDPRVEFAHKSGFLAKTRDRLPFDELIALVSRAIIKNPKSEP